VAGWLGDQIGPLWALGLLGVGGLVWLACVATFYLRRRAGIHQQIG